MPPANSSKAPCRTCLTETRHEILTTRHQSGHQNLDGYGEVSWSRKYEMLECCGCETVTLRNSEWFSEDCETYVSYYPPSVSRRSPPWLHELEWEFRALLEEIYKALHSDCRRLALMGARTIVDMLILDKVGDVGSFTAKLKELEKQGYVGRRGRDHLEAALDAGSAAAHRGFDPNQKQLSQVMDIVESMVQSVYINTRHASEVKSATPARATKRSK